MQKISCPQCTAGFNADTSRAHQALGRLKCAWCGHVFDDPGEDETSEKVAEQASNFEVVAVTREELLPVEPVPITVEFFVKPDVPTDVESVVAKFTAALANSTTKEAMSEALRATVWTGEVVAGPIPLTLMESKVDATAECCDAT